MENIEVVISQATERAVADGLVMGNKDGDFEVQGSRYADMDDDQMLRMADISTMRLAALGWLNGVSEWDFEEVSYINPVNSLWAPKE